MRGDNGGNKALPQKCIIVSSDKRRGGEGGVAMMVAAAEDSGSRRQTTMATMDKDGGGQQRWWMMMACKIGRQTTTGKDKSGWERWRRQQSGNDGCGGRRRQRWTTKAKADSNGGGQQRHARLGGGLGWARKRVGSISKANEASQAERYEKIKQSSLLKRLFSVIRYVWLEKLLLQKQVNVTFYLYQSYCSFGGKPPKAREPLLWTNQRPIHQPLAEDLISAEIGHGGIDAPLAICWKCGKTWPSLVADQSAAPLRCC